ncbi:MAG: methylmalonyl Co-A mutase-associated GTPase MeaB, partial [Gammaproteobacteria bacterium]|nr:methylmalonyl Co-A mutase-associated GTPase MeaB [Gammaproteobacteria bacterium]
MVHALRSGNRAAIARAITTVESGGPGAAEVSRAIRPHLGRARVVGITGAPGVGKSTLAGVLIAALRRRGSSVGVVAVDPSSPVSGGAILGDRVRMTAHGDDEGVFIRSLASGGRSGGLSLATARVVDVMDAAGFDYVLIETVGAGQSEIEVAEVADVTVVVSAPGLGDDIQAMKAGLLEIADVLVVNKADDPVAAVTVRQLTGMLRLRQDARRE